MTTDSKKSYILILIKIYKIPNLKSYLANLKNKGHLYFLGWKQSPCGHAEDTGQLLFSKVYQYFINS